VNGTSDPVKPNTKAADPTVLARGFALVADRVAHIIGQPHTFIWLCISLALWAGVIFAFHLGDGWQPMLTAINIVTFLIVFLIQSTQNRNDAAIQAKLDELIRALEPAENKFRGIEKLTIEEVHELREAGAEDPQLPEPS
jgi:low affinity Fe/Cu permease